MIYEIILSQKQIFNEMNLSCPSTNFYYTLSVYGQIILSSSKG